MKNSSSTIAYNSAGLTKNREAENWQWDDIRYFLELYRQGSIAGAARTLGVRHSTVSRHLARLEHLIGEKLFNRKSNSLELLEPGRNILERALMIERDALMIRAMGQRNREIAGKVTLSSPPMLLRHMIMPRLDRFFEAHRNIELVLLSDARQADLQQNEADIAVSFVRPEGSGLVYRTLKSMTYSVYAHPKWKDVPPSEQSIINLTQIRNLTGDENFLKFAEMRHSVLTSNDMELAFNACLEGVGIALLPDLLAENIPRLERMDVENMHIQQDLFLVMREHARTIPRISIVADYLIAALRPLKHQQPALSYEGASKKHIVANRRG